MSVITISSQFGAGGPALGKALAEKMGMDYLDKQIIHRIALDLKIDPKEVEAFDEAQFEGMRGFFSKVFDFNALRRGIAEDLNPDSSYDDRDQIPFDYRVQGWIDVEIYKKMLVRVITAAAERGNAVIKGRGSQYILQNFPNAVHLRFVADEADRVSATAERRGISESEARKLALDMDRRGAEFVKKYFGADINDSLSYDLVLNTSRMSTDSCLDLIKKVV